MLLVAQRKLESIRVLDDVLERVKVIVVPTFLRIQQQPEQRFREIARSTPQGDNRFIFWESCASSYSCSVDAGVGTDPSIANPDSRIFECCCLKVKEQLESNAKLENLYQHRWTP